MTRVELGCFCLLLVDKSLNDCANFKGISFLHYAQNFDGFDYGFHLHYYGEYSVIQFTSDGVDAEVEYILYNREEYKQAICHFLENIGDPDLGNSFDCTTLENYVKSWLREVRHESQQL